MPVIQHKEAIFPGHQSLEPAQHLTSAAEMAIR